MGYPHFTKLSYNSSGKHWDDQVDQLTDGCRHLDGSPGIPLGNQSLWAISRPASSSGVCKHPGFHTKHGWQMKVHPLQIWNILRSFNPSSFGISYGFVAQYPYCVNWYADFCWLISPLLPLQSLFLLVKSIFLWMMSTSGMLMHAPPASVDFSREVGLIMWRHESWLWHFITFFMGAVGPRVALGFHGKIMEKRPFHCHVITRINEEMDVECPWFPQFPPMLGRSPMDQSWD